MQTDIFLILPPEFTAIRFMIDLRIATIYSGPLREKWLVHQFGSLLNLGLLSKEFVYGSCKVHWEWQHHS
jgi:hypothetical protein